MFVVGVGVRFVDVVVAVFVVDVSTRFIFVVDVGDQFVVAVVFFVDVLLLLSLLL